MFVCQKVMDYILGIDDQEYSEKKALKIFNNDNEVIAKSNLIVQLNVIDEEVLKNLSQGKTLIGVFRSLFK